MIRVLSPHLDDAILSLGQYLVTEPAVISTVFGGVPDEFAYLSQYDRERGFATSHAAMTARRNEDGDACAVLGCLSMPMTQFHDAQYRNEPADEDAITDALRPLVDHRVHLFAPLGLDHIDHEVVSRCARRAVASFVDEGPVEIVLYEDLPARVLHPEQVFAALDEVRAEGWEIDALPFPLPQGARSIKRAALECYRSQFGVGELDPCFLVPERAWRCTMMGDSGDEPATEPG